MSRLLLALATLALLSAALAGCTGGAGPQSPADADAGSEAGRLRASGLPPPATLAEVAPGGPLVADPLAVGPLATSRLPYDFGTMLAEAPNSVPPTYPVAVRGELTVPEGSGPYPLVLFMHGRHGTCDVAGFELLGAYACPNAVVVTPVDSYQGYRPVADLLASHGYVVASIDANHINERDQAPVTVMQQDYGARARGGLALATLDHLAQANATGAAGSPEQALPSLQGRIDLSRIGLMGHSRGGEGMARAVLLNAEAAQPAAIRALFALAPTDFARWEPTGVAFATLLPYCDGDVSSLHGSWMYDDLRDAAGAGTLHQVLSMGANHNFYNDRWTGDDWGTRDDPWCDRPDGAGRDEPAQQMAQGAAVLSSFFRMEVGGEPGFDAYWTGAAPFPAGACGAPCDARLLVSRHATPADRLVLSADGRSGEASGAVRVASCSLGAQGDCRDGSIGQADRANVTWSGAGAIRYGMPEQVPDGLDALTLRIAVHGSTAAGLHVRLLDAAGGVLLDEALPAAALAPSPGETGKKLVLSMARVPLAGTDIRDVAAVELAFMGSGEAQLADVMLQDEDPAA